MVLDVKQPATLLIEGPMEKRILNLEKMTASASCQTQALKQCHSLLPEAPPPGLA